MRPAFTSHDREICSCSPGESKRSSTLSRNRNVYLKTMPIPITMPRLSDTMEAGTIIKWNVKEGDKVSSGDVIADIETDKATMEMTAYDDGTVAKIAVPEGQSTPIGSVIAVLA